MWLMNFAALVGGFQIIELINGWPYMAILLYGAPVGFVVGLIGVVCRWREEIRIAPTHPSR
jgi:hypothetical protein